MASIAEVPTEEFVPRTIDPDDERAFMDAIEKWVEGEVKPVVMEHDHGDIWPEKLVDQMG